MRYALAITALLAAFGCQVGPGRDDLRQQIQARLDERFGGGLFEVASLKRRGHYSYTAEEDKREQVLIYYDAVIRFGRDHVLSNWNKLNVGSLVSLLGATPLGVEGVKAEGNRQGDLLSVRGAFAFAREGEAWVSTTFRGTDKAGAGPAAIDKSQLPYRQHLERIGQVGAALHGKDRQQELRALTAELESLLATAERRQGRAEGLVTVATGAQTGEYFRQGSTLARLLTEAGAEARAYSSSGSVENCRLVNDGAVEFAYAQNDIAAMAFRGSDLFAGEIPMTRLRALCSLYPEAVHVVVLKQSSVARLADLRGKRIDIGPDGSGSRVNAVEVLAAAGLGLGDFGALQGKAPGQALVDLERGAIDAMVMTSAFPAPQLGALAERKPIRLLPLDDVVREALKQRSPHLISLWLPEKTYAGMDQGCRTVGVTAMLVAREDAPAERVQALLTRLYAGVDQLARDSTQALLISRERARAGVSIPLHETAERFFAK